MEKNTRSVRYWLSLLVYGLVLIGVLLYVRFPADKVQEYVSRKLQAITGAGQASFGECGYVFPLNLRCERITLRDMQDGQDLAELANVAVSPAVSGFGLSYLVQGEVAGGAFSFTAGVAPLAGRLTLQELAVTGADLSRIVFLQKGLQREIQGKLDFQGSLVGSFTGEGVVEMQGNVVVRDGGFSLRQPILFIERMEMAPLKVGVSMADGVLQLREGTVRGRQFSVDFSGELQLQGELVFWGVTLAGTMSPSKNFLDSTPQLQRVMKRLQKEYGDSALPYRVTGNLAAPRFRFGRQ